MNAFFIALVIALLAFVPVPTLQTLLATAASTLFESTPFILAGTLLAGAAPRFGPWAVPLFGCGCAGGRPARSIPAAVATAFAFGPLIAVARFVVSWLPLRARTHLHAGERTSFGAEISEVLLPAVIAAALGAAIRGGAVHALPLEIAIAAATVFAPCGFGALAFSNALRHISPVLATLALMAGAIFRFPRIFRPKGAIHDAAAYALGSLACALAAAHNGATLVNPRFTPGLWLCTVVLLMLCHRYRNERAPLLRWAPALMLVACTIVQPSPRYTATEWTMQDAFGGERIEFSGAVASAGGRCELVRYAITCCRADAQPVAVALARPVPFPDGTWMHVSGVFRATGARYVVDGKAVRIAPPADPFLYR